MIGDVNLLLNLVMHLNKFNEQNYQANKAYLVQIVDCPNGWNVYAGFLTL